VSRSRLQADRQRLLHRIRRRYQIVTERVELGRVAFDFTRIAEPDRVLDEVAAEADLQDRLSGTRASGDTIHLPYWAELWDSARGVAIFLQRQENDAAVRRHDVLDLGCGMGMSGTAAAALGAKVLFADLEPPALLFARLNAMPWRKRVRTRRLNWQRDALGRRFDLILGADILYERVQWPFLEAFWRAHLAASGRVILGEPGRQTGEAFIQWIASRGWRLSIEQIPVCTRPKPIGIFILEPSN